MVNYVGCPSWQMGAAVVVVQCVVASLAELCLVQESIPDV